MILLDVDDMPGVLIKITERHVVGRLVYLGEALVDGEPAIFIDRDSAGRRIRRELPMRLGAHSASGLAELVDVLTHELHDCELVR